MSKKKNLLTATASMIGAAVSAATVFAAPTEVYNKDGLTLTLNNDNGQVSLIVKNETSKDMHDVTLKNNDIKGLKLSDKTLSVGTVKAGETKTLEFKYELEKAVVTEVSKAVKEQAVKAKTGNKKVQTSDESSVMKVTIPVVVAGISGVMILLVAKRNKKNAGRALALLLSAGILGTGLMTNTSATELVNINKETGREYDNIAISGEIEVEGDMYDYVGNFYFETDHVEVVSEDEEIAVGIKIEESAELNVGEYEVVEGDVAKGVNTYKVKKVNGQVVEKNLEVIVPAKDYVVKIGTKEHQKEEVIPFETTYVANKLEDIGFENTKVEGEDGLKTTVYKLTQNLDKFKQSVLDGKADKSLLLAEDVNIDEPTTKVIEKGVLSYEEVVVEPKTVYVADNEKLISEEDEVLVEPEEGLIKNTYADEVDAKTGELLNQKELTASNELKPVVHKKVSVGAKEIVRDVVIPAQTEYVDLPNAWISHIVTLVNKDNGLEDITYNYEVDEALGRTENKTIVDRVQTKAPVTERIERGLKDHEYRLVQENERPVDFKVAYKTFVNALTEIDSLEKIANVNADFDGQKSGNGNIIEVPGVKGKMVTEVNRAFNEDGTVNTNYQDKDIKDIITVEPKTQTEVFKNFTTKSEAVNFNVRYQKDDSLAKGTSKASVPGVKGEDVVVTMFDNKELTDVAGSLRLSKKLPTTEVVNVGTKEVVTEKIERPVRVEYDDTKWDNYEAVKTEGKDGTKVTTFTYSVDEATGELSNRTALDVVATDPQEKVITRGTKKPEFRQVSETQVVLPAGPIVNNYVGKTQFDKLQSDTDVANLRKMFDDAHKGKLAINANTYQTKAAQNGEKGTIWTVAFDPATNQAIDSYQRVVWTEVDTPATREERMTFNLVSGETRQLPEVYEYKANPSLAFNQTVTKVQAKAGTQQKVTAGNLTKWVSVAANPAQVGQKEVGNVKVEESVIAWDSITTQVNKDINTWDTDVLVIPGEDGLSQKTTTYEVSSTGTLVNPKVVNKVIKAATPGEKWVGAITKVAGHSFQDAKAQEFGRLINEERAKLGLAPFKIVISEEVHDASHKILERLMQLRIFSHMYSGYDNVIATGNVNTTAQDYVNGFKQSPSHWDILTTGETSGITGTTLHVSISTRDGAAALSAGVK